MKRRAMGWSLVVLAGVAFGCAPQPETSESETAGADGVAAAEGITLAMPYRARGNEPFWALEIRADSMIFTTPERVIGTALPPSEILAGGVRYSAAAAGQPFVATVGDAPCADGMSGMPYPHTVSVMVQGTEYRGCGGEPFDVLAGGAWRVEDINGAGIIDRSQVTLEFADGRVAGSSGCNSYTAPVTLSGEGISVGEVVGTLKACAEALMDQEQKFIAALEAAERFEIDPTGALILHGSGGQSILARRDG